MGRKGSLQSCNWAFQAIWRQFDAGLDPEGGRNGAHRKDIHITVVEIRGTGASGHHGPPGLCD